VVDAAYPLFAAQKDLTVPPGPHSGHRNNAATCLPRARRKNLAAIWLVCCCG